MASRVGGGDVRTALMSDRNTLIERVCCCFLVRSPVTGVDSDVCHGAVFSSPQRISSRVTADCLTARPRARCLIVSLRSIPISNNAKPFSFFSPGRVADDRQGGDSPSKGRRDAEPLLISRTRHHPTRNSWTKVRGVAFRSLVSLVGSVVLATAERAAVQRDLDAAPEQLVKEEPVSTHQDAAQDDC